MRRAMASDRDAAVTRPSPEAKRYLENGYEWVVDLDLEKFFDRVHHQRLRARLETTVNDRRLLVLIHRMLKAKVVMPDGVVVSTEEGVPQGGPLSPLLSNIVLDELDCEFARRGYHCLNQTLAMGAVTPSSAQRRLPPCGSAHS